MSSLAKGNRSSALFSFQSNSLSLELTHSFVVLEIVGTINSMVKKLEGTLNQSIDGEGSGHEDTDRQKSEVDGGLERCRSKDHSLSGSFGSVVTEPLELSGSDLRAASEASTSENSPGIRLQQNASGGMWAICLAWAVLITHLDLPC